MHDIGLRFALKAAEPAQQFVAIRVRRKTVDLYQRRLDVDRNSEDHHPLLPLHQLLAKRARRLEADAAHGVLRPWQPVAQVMENAASGSHAARSDDDRIGLQLVEGDGILL